MYIAINNKQYNILALVDYAEPFLCSTSCNDFLIRRGIVYDVMRSARSTVRGVCLCVFVPKRYLEYRSVIITFVYCVLLLGSIIFMNLH